MRRSVMSIRYAQPRCVFIAILQAPLMRESAPATFMTSSFVCVATSLIRVCVRNVCLVVYGTHRTRFGPLASEC